MHTRIRLQTLHENFCLDCKTFIHRFDSDRRLQYQIKTMLNFGFIHSLVRLTWNRALLCLLAVFLFCQAGRAQVAIGSGGGDGRQAAARNQPKASSQITPQITTNYAPFVEPKVVKSESAALNLTLNLAVASNTLAGRVIWTANYNA